MSQSVTRIGKVGVLGHLDELERLMREYCNEKDGDGSDAVMRRLFLSGFLVWLRQRQRQSVVAEKVSYDYEGRDPMCSAGES